MAMSSSSRRHLLALGRQALQRGIQLNEKTAAASTVPLRHKSDKTVSKARLIDQLGQWDSGDTTIPVLSKESSIHRGTIIPEIDAAKVGVCTNMGRRPYQEDRFNVSMVLKNLLFLAVWDGHGGPECSEFCSLHVETELLKEIEQHGERVDLGAALRRVVRRLNASFEKHWNAVRTSPNKRAPGTTATIAVVRDGYELVVAQVGDSRAILCRADQARRLTRDHCPSDPDEKRRVEEHGGTVVYDTVGRYMVNGRLSMSRSIGDFDLKPYGVTAEPEVIRKNLKHGKIGRAHV